MHVLLSPAPALSVRDIRLNVRLGVTEEERAEAQPVSVHIDLHFRTLPACCETGEIAGAFCYDRMARILAETASSRSFALVEEAGYRFYLALKEYVGDGAKLVVQTVKLRPPADNLHGGAGFTCGDGDDGGLKPVHTL